MASTTTEVVVVETTARMAVGAERVSIETMGRHSRNTQREEECQDINIDDTHWFGDNMVGDAGGGGGGNADGGKDKTSQHENYHSEKIHQFHHHYNNSHHHQQSDIDETTYQLVPPDGGWGWMVALGTFIIATLLPIAMTCFSVMFSEYLLGASSSSTANAWIFNLGSFLISGSALLVRPLTEEFGWRLVAVPSSLMAAVGVMISAFTPSPSFLFFSFSLLTGLGSGLVITQCPLILPQFFQKRLGLANAIFNAGISSGQLAGPPVTRFLQISYGFRGATLILGAILLNACVGASFFHPSEWHQKKVPPKKEQQEETSAFTTKVVGPPDMTSDQVPCPSESSFTGDCTERETDGNLVVRERLLDHHGGRRGGSCSSAKRSSRHSSTLSLSSLGMGSFTALPVEEKPEDENLREEGRKDMLMVRVVKTLMRDLRSLKSLRVCILCLTNMLCVTGFINFIMMVPFAMLDAGFSLEASAWCISVSAGSSMVARILISSLSDLPRFNKRLAYMCSLAIIASSMFAFTFISSLDWLMVTMAVYGIGAGTNTCIYILVIIDVMGVEGLAPVFGIASFSVAIGFISFGPLLGFIRDMTQSYTASICFTGGMLTVALMAWLFMDLAERVDRRREEGKTLREALQKT